MKVKKILSLFLVAALVLGTFAACGGNDSKEESEGSDGILVWNMGTEPKYIDPQLNTSADGGHIDNNLFEGLMIDTKEGLEYGAAESYTVEANAEGVENTVYTFTIRENAKWSDGEPLKAQDFEYAWERACKPETTASSANLIFDYVKGAKEFYDGEGTLEDVQISCSDDKTLRVELKNPTPYFLNLTAFYTYMPCREDFVEGKTGWDKNPETCISNGPFKMTEYKIGSHIMMEKNENYWDAENVKLNGVKALMIQEPTTSLQGYQAGDIQVTDCIPQEDVPKLIAEDPNFHVDPSMSSAFYSFNLDVEPTNDINVRKAMTLAIDRKALVEQVLRGGEVPAVGYIPPGFTLSDGETSVRATNENGKVVKEYGIDPWNVQIEEAQAYLAKAGYPNGEGFPTIELLYNQNENDKKIAEAIQNMWKENLGITVELREEGFFLQSVSHGLKTPIMVIKNCCQALKDGIYIHNSKEYTISVIEEEADTLEDTIKKFLIINSFDYMLGKKSDFVEIKIRRMLRDIVDRVSAGNKDLDILLSGEEYSVWGTMDLLKSAINNLMENAIRYANTYIHIEILPDESNPEKYILVAIKNDGDEIEESTIAGFFQKYHKGRKGNFGLGLYITKRIMEFHDGEVWAENKTKEVKFVMKMKRYEKI